ncbi:MAG: Hpt domain-containing protein [Treponema sp.]|nr:Hpt domain-containing protein [Treponema sp.]
MDIKSFYDIIGGDYEEVLSRLATDQRIQKYLFKFLDVPDYNLLLEGLAQKDWEKSFLAAHTLKGNALNLGLGNFTNAVKELTEFLRPRIVEDEEKLNTLAEKTKIEYENLIAAINEYKKSAL